MIPDRPLVSVIVPSFNQARFLPETLASILAQSYRPLELLVVDGASTDGSVEVLQAWSEHPELRWLSEPDDGPADAVNKGLAMAKGTIAGIQSSDDTYLPGAIGAAVAAFTDHPDLGIVYGDATVVDQDGVPLATTSYLPFSLRRFLCGSTFILQSSAFFRPELARQLGGWRPQYFVMDVDLWLRMAFRAPVRKLPIVMSTMRRHEAQRDKQTAAIWESYWRMIDESTDLAQAPLGDRLAARAGRRMLTQHYNPTGTHRRAMLDLWRGIATYPPAVRAIAYPELLVPGRLARFVRSEGPLTRGGRADV